MHGLLLFDFDGVIVDSLDDQCHAYAEAVRAHGLPELASRAQFLDFTEDNWFVALATAGVPAPTVAAIEDAIAATPSPPLFPSMGRVLEHLTHTNSTVIISSSRTSVIERVLDEHHVRGITAVMGGDDEPSKARKIRRACTRYGGSRPAWYVGDTVGDIVEARSAGAGAIAAAWGWHGRERLQRAFPDRMAEAPSDLLGLL
jgi:phosphoglycolate phosphatase